MIIRARNNEIRLLSECPVRMKISGMNERGGALGQLRDKNIGGKAGREGKRNGENEEEGEERRKGKEEGGGREKRKEKKIRKMETMRRSPTGHSVFNGFNYLTSICEVPLKLRAQSIQH